MQDALSTNSNALEYYDGPLWHQNTIDIVRFRSLAGRHGHWGHDSQTFHTIRTRGVLMNGTMSGKLTRNLT